MQKNVASQKWIVFAFDRTDNTVKTGDAAQITANLRLDGGAANAVDDTNPTELEDGFYIFDITQAEANADLILMTPASSTADIQVIGVPGALYTTAPNFNALGIESDGDITKVNLCANTTLVDTLTTYTSNTVQSGDSFARLGAPSGASVSADILVLDNFLDTEIAAILAAVDTEVAAIVAATITNATGADVAADIIALKAETVLIVEDTNELQTDWADAGRLDAILDGRMAEASISTTGGAVDTVTTVTNQVTAAAINAEVVDVMRTDTLTLPGQGDPTATPTTAEAIAYLYKWDRNLTDQSATLQRRYGDDGTTVDQQRIVASTGLITTLQEIVSG